MNYYLAAQASKLPVLTVSDPSKPPCNIVQNPNIILSCSCTTNILTPDTPIVACTAYTIHALQTLYYQYTGTPDVALLFIPPLAQVDMLLDTKQQHQVVMMILHEVIAQSSGI